MTRRSMPIPSPAAGGIPYSRARMKSSSHLMRFFVPCLAFINLLQEPTLSDRRDHSTRRSIRHFPSDHEQFEPLDKVSGPSPFSWRARNIRGIIGDKGRWISLGSLPAPRIFRSTPCPGGSPPFSFRAKFQRIFPGLVRIGEHHVRDTGFPEGIQVGQTLPRRGKFYGMTRVFHLRGAEDLPGDRADICSSYRSGPGSPA